MTFTFPWPPRMLSPNVSGHWAKKASTKKAYRTACKRIVDETQVNLSGMPPDATVSVLMRFYPPSKRHYDWDNLIASMKAGLDGLADGLGVNDNLFRPTIEVAENTSGGKVVIQVEVM